MERPDMNKTLALLTLFSATGIALSLASLSMSPVARIGLVASALALLLSVGVWIRALLAGGSPHVPARLQDRYSVRCAPHVAGVLVDAAAMARGVLDIEIAGVNDNPVIDPVTGTVLHGRQGCR